MTKYLLFCQFIRYPLLSLGFHISEATKKKRLIDLINKLRPIKTKHELIRVGSSGDGGYLLPNDLKGVVANFSPGVDYCANFEIDILNRFGINSHLLDYSVDAPPSGCLPLTFTKKFLGASDNAIYTTVDSWVSSQVEFKSEGDFIMQIDIEGAEYVSLLSASDNILRRFRIIVMEIHLADYWSDPNFFNVVEAFFDKILSNFYVVHIHPNNCCPVVKIRGVPIPPVFEMTLLRKDRSEPKGFNENYPHQLDCDNWPNLKQVILPKNWFNN
jgi:hypothetical protein